MLDQKGSFFVSSCIQYSNQTRIMKFVAALIASLSLASAFAPPQRSRSSSQLSESLFDKIADMDLFSPVKEQNDYGARKKMKKTKQAKLGAGSYVPAGLSLADYQKIRERDVKKADANYEKNVKKAGKYLGFDEFYAKRGTEVGGKWIKAPGRGHTFAKTKYDFSGGQDDTKGWSDALGSIMGKK